MGFFIREKQDGHRTAGYGIYLAAGVAALHVLDTGITDYGAVCDALARFHRLDGHDVFRVRVGVPSAA